MRERNLLIGGIAANGALLIVLCLCLILGIYVAATEPAPLSLTEEPATEVPTATETPAPTETSGATPVPTQTATPTLIPMPLVTPIPTREILEPTKLPYVFPTAIRIP